MSEFAYVWEYRVRSDRVREFETVYGPEGEWARLFRRAPGYRRTELLRDRELPNRYLTIDYWESREACGAFRQRFRAEFEALDERCERLTESETWIGDFEAFDRFGSTLKELLLADSPRGEIPIPSRRRWRRRAPAALK